MTTIRTFAPHEWAIYKDLRLRALADAPEAFGSTLAAEKDHSEAEWSGRLARGASSGWDLPLVAEVDGQPFGLAWGQIDESDLNVAHLYQMWVAPSHRRLGVGQMLLEAVMTWARAKNASYLDLGVTYRDSPAMRLYTRAGFEPAGPPEAFRPGAEFLGLPIRRKL